eukprot:TRINITY_DN7860_c0_g1_i1.p1 TRINITY_DN7860_c0_g1~~TRINITY_DN7860_c0_g1_i1.p1  ORF type:complete len:323 (-),score=50.56 TRINITY_DN7860_c0_g1_i1:480-1448(-)
MSDTDPSIEAKPPLQFTVVASDTMARAGLLTLPHVENALTPMFMPVGTQGTVKGITCDQLREIGFHVILGNTYHLGMRPGPELLEEMGGLHKFMDWDRGILTDSGGFQMVSLLQLAEITEEGVRFQSPHDGTSMLLTPERSIELQNSIGADIIMALDDVVSSTTTGPRVEEATHRTLRWLDRCFAAHKRPHDQILFPIIQGGLDPRLREICLDGTTAMSPSSRGFQCLFVQSLSPSVDLQNIFVFVFVFFLLHSWASSRRNRCPQAPRPSNRWALWRRGQGPVLADGAFVHTTPAASSPTLSDGCRLCGGPRCLRRSWCGYV